MTPLKIFGWILIVGLAVGVLMEVLRGMYKHDSGTIVGLSLGIVIAYFVFISPGSPLRGMLS